MIVAWIVGVALLGVGMLAASLYAPDKPRAELEAAYPGVYRTVDGVRLRLRDTGPRDAPAVIMLHGFGASLDTWEPWAQALSGRYRVVRFDLPGFGLTGVDPTGDYSDARTMTIIAGLMDQLKIKRASMIGNSLGDASHGISRRFIPSGSHGSCWCRRTGSPARASLITRRLRCR